MKEWAFTMLAILFLLSWIWTEIEERVSRGQFHQEINQFMEARGPAAGNRFTAEDGDKLRNRIEALEQRVGLEVTDE